MKKPFALAIMVMFTCALLAFVGCGQTEGSTGGGKSMKVNLQDPAAGVRVAAIDVGKGDCILVQAGGSSVLIDAGYEDTSDEVVSYLRSHGVDLLDCLVITHYDKDHIGGIRAVGKAFEVSAIYLPGYTGADKQYRMAMDAVDDLGVPTQLVTSEQVLKLGDANLAILPSRLTYNPNADGGEGNDNDLSLVAELTYQNDSYLFAGDLEKEGLEAYLKGGRGRFDVLKMPHHGEKSGNTDDFLEDVQPKIAIVTDSAEDPADKKTLKLLKNCGADTYCTSVCGTIVVESDGAGSYSVSVGDR